MAKIPSFIFIAGHHKSGTTLLQKIICEHPLISGISQTDVPRNEGQWLQSVYETALFYGGPGKYIYDIRSYMNEHHVLATEKSAKTIRKQWESFYDPKCKYYVEKSPPNLIRTRFLQKLFPNSKFIVILRHPLVISYATQKWRKVSIKSLLEHSLKGYEIFIKDIPYLKSVYVLRYEDLVSQPQNEVDRIYDFLGLESKGVRHTINTNSNDIYFSVYRKDRSHFLKKIYFPISSKLEKRVNKIGYSIKNYKNLVSSSILDSHKY